MKKLHKRYPAVAGLFYEADKENLIHQIEACFNHKLGPGKIPSVSPTPLSKFILISPHAGYIYSGPTASHGYYRMANEGTPKTVVILGPNHYGLGSAIAMEKEGIWITPLGETEIDQEVAQLILNETDLIDIDSAAHLREHSLEVQLPFLQYLYRDKFRIVPINFSLQDLEASMQIGEALSKVMKNKNIALIASTDLTHYEPQESANKKDNIAINDVLSLDAESLYEHIKEYNISMCGVAPVIVAITVAKSLNLKKGVLLSYTTSGDITGDYSQVVGYASIAFS